MDGRWGYRQPLPMDGGGDSRDGAAADWVEKRWGKKKKKRNKEIENGCFVFILRC